MYLEVHWKLALAVVLAVLLWPHRPLLVRKMATPASLFEEYARGRSWKGGEFAASS